MAFTFLLEKQSPEKSHDFFAQADTMREKPPLFISSFNKFLVCVRTCVCVFQRLQGSVGYAKINQSFQTSDRAKQLC